MLELLDQVGDAISTYEPVHKDIQLLMSRSELGFDDEKYRRSDPPVEGLVLDQSAEGRRESPILYFLVLEVCGGFSPL